MDYNPDARIRIDCNNWYKFENDLVKVIARNGNIMILNINYGTMWVEISETRILSELYEKLKRIFSEDAFFEMLENLCELEIINIVAPENEFDLIFN